MKQLLRPLLEAALAGCLGAFGSWRWNHEAVLLYGASPVRVPVVAAAAVFGVLLYHLVRQVLRERKR